MRMNMNLIPSILLPNRSSHKDIWLWPSCTNHTKTLSFRATTNDDGGSLYLDPKESLAEAEVELTTLDSCFTTSSESVSISTESEKYFDHYKNDQCSSTEVETIVRGARSERLFFEPDSTSCIFETQESDTRQYTGVVEINNASVLAYKESVAMVVDSENPYDDFKKSMEEMVESHEIKDWDCLEELLRWYLRMNGKNNHEFIVGAFVDLLAGISGGGCRRHGGGSDHSTASFNSAASTFSSPISSPLAQVGREKKIMEEGITETGEGSMIIFGFCSLAIFHNSNASKLLYQF